MQYTEGYLLDNRYQLERYIGSGSFGEVWVATDKATDLEVATKIYVAMDEKGLEDFKKEFQLSFELNHSNLLHANYLGVNPEDRRPFLVMPFCPEGAVTQFAGKMTEDQLWRFTHDVAAGLAYLHGQQPAIIHQDIKPDNILIHKNGEYVITDFGISKQLRASLRKSAMKLNSAGAISYMGPERFSKQYQAVKASDIWSLGVSIYELATGELPFCGMGGSLQKQGADMPELPEEFSETLNMVCQACMAKEPWNRPTAQQLADFTDRYMKGENPPVTWGHGVHKPEETAAAKPAEKAEPQKAELKRTRRPSAAEVSEKPISDKPLFSSNDSKEGRKGIPAWVWGLIAALVLALLLLLLLPRLKNTQGKQALPAADSLTVVEQPASTAAGPSITHVTKPVYNEGKKFYSFTVEATGEDVTYHLADANRNHVSKNTNGMFSAKPVTGGKYFVYAEDVHGNQSPWQEVTGCTPVQAEPKPTAGSASSSASSTPATPSFSKVTADELAKILNAKNTSAARSVLEGRIASNCSFTFTGLTDEEKNVSKPRTYVDIINRMDMGTWSSINVSSVGYDGSGKLNRATIHVNY